MYKQREKYLHVEGPEKANISGNANNVTNILLPVSLLSTRMYVQGGGGTGGGD